MLTVQVTVYGIIALWLLLLIPAAVITLLKGRWMEFFIGWLTFGVAWVAGAAVLGPADSWWAQRFYGAKRMARAAEPLRGPRSIRAIAIGTIAILIAIAVLGLMAARPAPVLGVNGKSLGNSVPGRGGGVILEVWPHLGPCKHRRDDRWDCALYDYERSGGTVNYRVKVDDLGCWRAWPTERGGDGRYSGCITMIDYFLSIH